MANKPWSEVLIGHLAVLYARWGDEEGLEDFADYRISMKRALPKGATNFAMGSDPFKVEFDHENLHHCFEVEKRGLKKGTVTWTWTKIGITPEISELLDELIDVVAHLKNDQFKRLPKWRDRRDAIMTALAEAWEKENPKEGGE